MATKRKIGTMKRMKPSSSELSLWALLFSLLALIIAGWNFYVLGTWTRYWDDVAAGQSIPTCEAYYDVATQAVIDKAQEIGITVEGEALPTYPDVFYSEELSRCVAFFTFYDSSDIATDYGFDLESSTELSPLDVSRIVTEFTDLYLVE